MEFNKFVLKIISDMKERNPEMEINTQTIEKLQGQSYKGLVIREMNENVSVTINLDDAFEKLQEGTSYRKVLEKIDLAVREGAALKPDVDVQALSNYEKMAETLVMQLVSVDGNEELLKKVPHQVTGDIVTVYRFQIEKDSEKTSTILITNQMLDNYHVTAEQLHCDALEYAPKNEKPVIKTMTNVMMEMFGEEVEDSQNNMYMATVESMINGAAVINYPGILEEAAHKIGGDFYVLPSSVHEVLFLKDNGEVSAFELNNLVSFINESEVDAADRLSDHAYHYDSKEKILEMANDFEMRKQDEKEMDQEETIKVLLVEPGKYPSVIEIGKELEDLQAAVGGYIEEAYPFDEPVTLIINEEGKINGEPLNRALRDREGRIYDVVAGSFLIAGITTDDLCSLTNEQISKYEKHFHQPEAFVQTGRSFMAIPIPDEIVKKNSEKTPVRNTAQKVSSEVCR